MSGPYSYTPLTSKTATRILHLLPSRDHQSPLVCELEDVSLVNTTSKHDYKALSYVWGRTEVTAQLWCAGMWISITKNCEAALRHLRHKKHNITLWVDSVCINQADADEKAVQIPLIGPIYRQATCVVVWLGAGTKNTTRCFSRLKLWKAAVNSGLATNNRMLLGPLFRHLTGSMTVDECQYLIDNDWPKRGCTIQEVALATKVEVMCGEATASWEDFYAFVSHSTVTMLKLDLVDYSVAQTWDHPWSVRDKILSDLEIHGAVQKVPSHELGDKVRMLVLIGLVTASHLSKTSDPKDRAYSLYGLLVTIFPALPEVDYTLSKEEIYTSLTRATIMATESFWPALVDTGMIDPSATLPSWVPSLDHYVKDRDTTLIAGFRYLSNLRKQPARSDNRLPAVQNGNERMLTLRGSCLTVVLDTGIRWSNMNTADCDPLSRAVLAMHAWYGFFLRATNQEHLYSNLDETPKGLLDLLFQGERHEDEDRLQQVFPSMMKWLLDHGDSILSINWGLEIWQDMKKVSFFNRPNLRNSIIFEGRGGHVGRTEGLIEKGDSVVLLACCEVPVILRPRGEHWQYIGPAHIAYKMDSTLWPDEDKDLTNFSLI